MAEAVRRLRGWCAAEGPGLLCVWALILGLWLAVSWPLASGERTLVARDVFTIHLPFKWFGAQQLHEGRIPAFNAGWGMGQPFRGNPNAVALYPGNVLYLVLPFWSAFGLHYALHWLLALFAMRALARGLGQERGPALLAGVTYAGSGYLLSALTFYNLLAVVAWWPLVLLGAARGGRRGTLLGGVACGMALLGGEPVTALLGVVPVLLVAWGATARWREGAVRAALLCGVGLAVALPQIVATWRVLPFTYRAAHGISAAEGSYSRFPLVRFLELWIPLPFGAPWEHGPRGFIGGAAMPWVPFIVSVHVGVVALVLAARAAPRHRAWAALGAAGAVLACLLTSFPGTIEAVSGGLARYPEKLLLWFALAVPLLAGFGLQEAQRTGGLRRTALVLAGLSAGGAIALWLAADSWLEWFRRLAPAAEANAGLSHLALWILSLGLAALALAATAGALRRGWPAGVIAAQILGLSPLAVTIATDDTAPYRQAPPWAAALPAGANVLNGTFDRTLGQAEFPYPLLDAHARAVRRLAAQDLASSTGVLSGLRYPLTADFDGMTSLPVAQVLRALPTLSWDQRVQWLRAFGVDAVVLAQPPPSASLRPIASADRAGGVQARLFAVDGRMPAVWWPRSVLAAGTPEEAFERLAAVASLAETAVILGSSPAQDPGGSARLLTADGDRIELETAGAGGVVALARAYQPALRAAAAGRPLSTLRLDFALLGVVVPAGPQHVIIEISAWPEVVAGAIAGLVLAGSLFVAWRSPRAEPFDPRALRRAAHAVLPETGADPR